MDTCGNGHDLATFRFTINGTARWGCRECRRLAAEARWTQPSDLPSRFWSKVDRRGPDECWPWKGALIPNGYGSLGTVEVDGRVRTQVGAHRVSFFIANGYWPRMVRHTCDNPPCVNPAHLLSGDAKSNAQDMLDRGRCDAQQRTHCPQGHPYSDENTLVTRHGHRQCRECGRQNARVQAAKQRERDPEEFKRKARERSSAYKRRQRNA